MNRIAGKIDEQIYGSYIKEGDVIIDTPTKAGEVVYYFMGSGKEFPELKDEATFWFDGNRLGYLNMIKFQNTVKKLPWQIKRGIFKPIPGTIVKSKAFSIEGLNECIIDGETDEFYSLKFWTKERRFVGGQFGFHAIQNLDDGHGFLVSVQDGGSITMKGFESQHGFSGIRIQPSGNTTVNNLLIENFYIHDTCTGEGMYIGSTQAPPTPKFLNVTIRNGIITRTAAEAIQIQNVSNGYIHNVSMYNINTDWLNAFQNYQSTGFQFTANGGESVIEKVILDGFAANGFMPFSVNPIEYTPKKTNKVTLTNSLFYNGRGAMSYLNKSMCNGIKWAYIDVNIGGFDGSFFKETGNRSRSLISGANTDELVLMITHDNSKKDLFDDIYKYNVLQLNQKEVEAPIYINSGFTESPNQIMQWKSTYGNYHEGPDNTPTKWLEGQIAIDIDDDYRFYLCIKEHNSTDIRPRHNPGYFTLLKWDKAGIRSDQPNWDEDSEQSLLPPDDLRIARNYSYSTLGVQIPTLERIVKEYYLDGKRVTITDSNTY